MNATEFRNHHEYVKAMDKIKSYRKDFEFTIEFSEIPKPKANALKLIMSDAIALGLVKSVATYLSLDLDVTAETFKRI